MFKYLCCCYTYDSIRVINKNPFIDGNDIKMDDTEHYTLPIKKCRVIKVYDGDTITVATKFKNDNTIYRFSVRLNGIDSPEIKGKNISEDEKNAAQASKEFLSNLILNKSVELKNVQNMQKEKFGRVLADVYLGDINVNQLMIDKKFAVKYDGGNKGTNKPESWTKFQSS